MPDTGNRLTVAFNMRKSLLALLALCVIGSTGFAQTYTYGYWLYTVYSENGTDVAKLVGVTDLGVEALYTTPGGFEVEADFNGYPLRTIGEGAFRRLAGLRSWDGIDFTGVTRVEADAFNGVYVKNLQFFSDTLIIENNAFRDCTRLETISAGNVPRIGGGAFSEANRFRGFYSLLGDWEGVVFIPPTVRDIGGGLTFYHCPTPYELTIPSGVTRIYNLTFFESPVVRLILPDTVTSVDRNALSYSYNDYSAIQELIFKGSPPAEPFASQGTIYRLPGASGWSNSFGGVPVQIFLEKATVTGMSPASGFQFSWSGTGTFPVNVERAPSPGGPWTVVSSNNTNGQFTDPAPPSGSAFYRAKSAIP